MANITVNDIIEVTFKGTCFEQVIENVFHYKVRIVPATPTSQLDFFTAMDNTISAVGELYNLYRIVLPGNWNATTNHYQDISPTRFVAFDIDHTGQSGLNTFNTLTANLGAVITKRGDIATRRNISNTHILATDGGTFIAGGKILSGPLLALDALAAKMRQEYTVGVDAGDITVTPVIYHRGITPNTSPITSTVTQTTVRTMRKRTLGVGI